MGYDGQEPGFVHFGSFPLSCNLNCNIMADNKTVLFDKQNYLWMAIGGVVMVLALLLMAGGSSADPKVFDKDQVYSTRRITVAPILLMLGLLIEVYAIMRKPKATSAE